MDRKMNFPKRRVKMNSAMPEVPTYVKELIEAQSDENIIAIWNKYKDNPIIEWKESIRKVIATRLPEYKW